MMEIIQFLFGNFWHFCGLVVVLLIIFNPTVTIHHKNKDENESDTRSQD